MRRFSFVFVSIFLFSSCAPATTVAVPPTRSLTATIVPTATYTLTPSPTFTPTITPTITPTPLGGGSGQIACLNCTNGVFPSISLVNPDGILTTLLSDKDSAGVSFDWSRNGTKLGYFSIIGTEEHRKLITCVIDAYGYDEQCFEIGGGDFALSPDGSKVAIGGHSQTLNLVDIDSGKSQILMEHQSVGYDWQVDWSPDGTQLAVAGIGIVVINVRNGEKYVLVEGKETDYFNSPHWSPDGNKIIFAKRNNLFIINADGSGELPLVRNAYNPIWSPDGTHIAYITGNSDQQNIIMMNVDGVDKVKLTPSQPIYDMRWTSDGNFIVYRTYFGSLYNGRFDLNAVDVNSQKFINFTKTHDVRSYTLSPDGSAIAYTLGSGDLLNKGECFKSFVTNLDGAILSEWKNISCIGQVGPWRPLSNSDENVSFVHPTKGQSWEFDIDGDAQGWKDIQNINQLQVSNGYLKIEAVEGISWTRSPLFTLDANAFPKIEIRMKIDGNSPVWLGFITSTDLSYDAPKTNGFNAIGDGQFHNYIIDMSKFVTWKGIIRQIQFKPVEKRTLIEIDYIRILP